MRKLIIFAGISSLLAACATYAPDEPTSEPVAEAPSNAPEFDLGGFESGGSSTEFTCANTSAYECVAVFYGTNRKAARKDRSGQQVFGPVASSEQTLGRLTVTIPRSRKPGSKIAMIGSEKEIVSEQDRAKVFAVWENIVLQQELFAKISSDELSNDPAKKKAIIYVHGFNTTFRNGSYRAAQIKYDLDFDGPIYYFSWPANGQANSGVRDYLSDLDDADLSAEPLANFLLRVRKAVGDDTKIYAVAHSMGTRVFMNALNNIAIQEVSIKKPLVNRLILAAGDLDRSVFMHWRDTTEDLIGDLTIYASNKDKPLRASLSLRNLFQFKRSNDPKTRIGLVSKQLGATILANTNAATIDISKYNDNWFSSLIGLNHADYVEENIGLRDIEALVNDEPLDPTSRNPDFRLNCKGQGRPLWVYKARKVDSGPC